MSLPVTESRTVTRRLPGNIFYLPTGGVTVSSQRTFPDELVEKILSSSPIEERLKMMIEASVADALARLYAEQQEQMDDPFDAIYLSELSADPISKTGYHDLGKYVGLKDLSESISFRDDWED